MNDPGINNNPEFSKLKRQVKDLINIIKTIGQPQTFTANAGQTDFITAQKCNHKTFAIVSGSIYTVGEGITVPGGICSFDSPMIGGEKVVIYNFPNI